MASLRTARNGYAVEMIWQTCRPSCHLVSSKSITIFFHLWCSQTNIHTYRKHLCNKTHCGKKKTLQLMRQMDWQLVRLFYTWLWGETGLGPLAVPFRAILGQYFQSDVLQNRCLYCLIRRWYISLMAPSVDVRSWPPIEICRMRTNQVRHGH